MSTRLQKAYASSQQGNPNQLSLGYDEKYKATPSQIVLAEDSRFVLVLDNTNRLTGNYLYPNVKIAWRYTIGVSSKSASGELEIVRDVAEFFNKNPQLVVDAAAEVIDEIMSPAIQTAGELEKNVQSPQEFEKVIQQIESIEAADDHTTDQHRAEAQKVMLLIQWFSNNFGKMSGIQKFVMWKGWLKPLSNRSFRLFGKRGQIELDNQDRLGKPDIFDKEVKDQATRLGATSSQKQSATELRESPEKQIERIERLLSEIDISYDLRMYMIQIGCTINKDVGGSESETATEIRGIPSVTTVRPNADKKRDITANSEYVFYDIKFSLLGSRSRVEYRDEILLPSLRKIKGLKVLTVSSMHRTNRQGTIRTVRESKVLEGYLGEQMGGFGGVAGALGSQRSNITNRRPTPRPAVQSMIDDWADGGVMAYDAPTDSTDMRYHTMMPVEDLLPYISRVYRGNKMDFDGRYKNFIRTGATHPVYLAIGQNGRAKVTGSEDLIWFAKKSGLEELPVFLSFQKQV